MLKTSIEKIKQWAISKNFIIDEEEETSSYTTRRITYTLLINTGIYDVISGAPYCIEVVTYIYGNRNIFKQDIIAETNASFSKNTNEEPQLIVKVILPILNEKNNNDAITAIKSYNYSVIRKPTIKNAISEYSKKYIFGGSEEEQNEYRTKEITLDDLLSLFEKLNVQANRTRKAAVRREIRVESTEDDCAAFMTAFKDVPEFKDIHVNKNTNAKYTFIYVLDFEYNNSEDALKMQYVIKSTHAKKVYDITASLGSNEAVSEYRRKHLSANVNRNCKVKDFDNVIKALNEIIKEQKALLAIADMWQNFKNNI